MPGWSRRLVQICGLDFYGPARLPARVRCGKGKNLVNGYAKKFGVDLGCALKDLQLLRVPLDPVSEVPEGYGIDRDDDFAFIAGFTSGGAPYGTTWEEVSAQEAVDADEGWSAERTRTS